MGIKVISHINEPVSSNCHILYEEQSHKCIIVDPGSEDGSTIDKVLLDNYLVPDYIILTHEHFDHIWSCSFFVDKYSIPIVCSEKCAVSIVDPKKNLSLFYNAIGFSCPNASIIIEDIDYKLLWNKNSICFYNAEGHSDSGIIFCIDRYLVVGDTLIKGLKTVTKLYCGSREKLLLTINKIESMKGNNLMVLSGHGENFLLDDYDLNIA